MTINENNSKFVSSLKIGLVVTPVEGDWDQRTESRVVWTLEQVTRTTDT